MPCSLFIPWSLRSALHVLREASGADTVLHSHACARVQVIIPNLLGDKELDTSITRADFERLCGDLFDQCSALAERLLQCAPGRLRAEALSCFRPCTSIVTSTAAIACRIPLSRLPGP